ncbi:LOW QUALITY PROTEIN: protein regulator of cytokinesis 1 [Heteronotia binoei]|uniref:LOW QUALITY PROTEIN: protein regulator of cytokinesis 1 n=1 Tax=Heteronotia binoei TaxID=13085 RepID=UPI00292F8CC6|nr:LOW QUALITY PROTEIN: protein regulator of cytokinesis 1 [Heteronotia binoei]
MRKSEGVADESVSCLREALGQLRDIWEEIGIPEEQRLERTQVVRNYVKELLAKMIAEEQSLKSRLLRSIQVWRGQLATLCRELHLPPFQEDREASILELEKVLRTQVEALLRERQERKEALQALREQELEMCDLLSITPASICANTVPTPEELDCFRHHLAALGAEKERRQAEFVGTRQKIVVCMQELEHVPDTSFERDVVCEEEDAFCLSEDNIAALKELLQQLESRKAQNEALCEELRSKILVLWDRLRVPAEERESFVPCMAGSRSQTLNALQLELNRLETLKLQNIRNMVEAVRVELADYWDKCFYGKEQRESFSPYYQDHFTEELLQQHEEEMARIKRFFETHQELFEAVRKWEGNWHLFQELERKATDPSRFTNRGGNLLKEEKLRAKLQKALPKLEEELRGRLELWEQEHGQAFLVNGQHFMEHVAEQWQLHHLEKEREKQERQLKKSRQIEEEMLFGSTPCTPSKRRVLGAATPVKVRKLNATASTPNSTIRSALGGSVFHSPASRPGSKPPQSVRTPCRTAAKASRPARLEHNKENVSQRLNGTALSGGCTSTAPAQRTHSINSVASTYSEFAHGLSEASRSESRPRVLNSTISAAHS